jgi:hypothetical protein
MKKLKNYPAVRITKCEHCDPYTYGINFCYRCNSIIFCIPHIKNEKKIEKDCPWILSYMTLFWILYRNLGKKTSSKLNNIEEKLEKFFFESKKEDEDYDI